MRGNWIKVVLFVLAVFMLAGITQVLLDPGLGPVDEANRTKHPAGFSAIPPRGWGGSVFYSSPTNPEDYMRISPEKSTGRQPTVGIVRTRAPFKIDPEATPFTFQGQPAYKTIERKRYAWTWRIDFERDSVNYHIAVTYPVEVDLEHSALWPFIESFRVEPVLNLAGATMPSATTVPATLPTTAPTAQR